MRQWGQGILSIKFMKRSTQKVHHEIPQLQVLNHSHHSPAEILQINMKFSSLLAFLPMAIAHGFPGRIPDSISNATAAEQCCCLTYKASCTMNQERLFHIKLFYNRKKGITPEEFNDYWANKHSALATNFHLRLGVVKYVQVGETKYFSDRLFLVPTQLSDSCMVVVPLHSRIPRSCSGRGRIADPRV